MRGITGIPGLQAGEDVTASSSRKTGKSCASNPYTPFDSGFRLRITDLCERSV